MKVINLFGVGSTFKFVNFYEFDYADEEWNFRKHLDIVTANDFRFLLEDDMNLALRCIHHLEFSSDSIDIFLD